MAISGEDIFDKFIKKQLKDDRLDTFKYTTMGTLMGSTRKEIEFIPDESYKTGPWLVHIIPCETNNGFERVYVCKACMAIGKNFLNNNICSFCGSKENEVIVAQWVKRPWYKRWFRKNKGHWESSDVD